MSLLESCNMPGNLLAFPDEETAGDRPAVTETIATFVTDSTVPATIRVFWIRLTTSSRSRMRFEIFRSYGWWAAENLSGGFAETIGPLGRAALEESAAIIRGLLFETAERCAVGPMPA